MRRYNLTVFEHGCLQEGCHLDASKSTISRYAGVVDVSWCLLKSNKLYASFTYLRCNKYFIYISRNVFEDVFTLNIVKYKEMCHDVYFPHKINKVFIS
jgi:hypothetical protein